MTKDPESLALLDEIHDLGRILTKFRESDCLHVVTRQEMPQILYNAVHERAIRRHSNFRVEQFHALSLTFEVFLCPLRLCGLLCGFQFFQH